jgi:hypothetical protein
VVWCLSKLRRGARLARLCVAASRLTIDYLIRRAF